MLKLSGRRREREREGESRTARAGQACFYCGPIKKKMKTIHNPHQVDVNAMNILVCLNKCVFRGKQAAAYVCDCACV